MKRFIITSLTSLLIAAAPGAMAQGIPVVLADHDFGTLNAFGRHYLFAANEKQNFAFTVPAGIAKVDIVFSDDPNTRDRTTRAMLATWKSGGSATTQAVNYSRVRVMTIPVTAGRYFFSVNTSTSIGFAVMIRQRKATVAAPPRRR